MYEKRKKDDRDRRACRLHQRKERERLAQRLPESVAEKDKEKKVRYVRETGHDSRRGKQWMW